MQNDESGTFADEGAVISTLLRMLYVGEGQVVRSHTRGGLGMPSDEARMLDFLRENLGGLKEETISDYLHKNGERHPVQPDLDPERKLIPVEDADFADIFRDGRGWTRFRETFPESDGTLRISRVGLDSEVTQALIYAGQQFDWEAGSSGFWLFEKAASGWVEIGRVGNDLR